jgi:hypothetical protein
MEKIYTKIKKRFAGKRRKYAPDQGQNLENMRKICSTYAQKMGSSQLPHISLFLHFSPKYDDFYQEAGYFKYPKAPF